MFTRNSLRGTAMFSVELRWGEALLCTSVSHCSVQVRRDNSCLLWPRPLQRLSPELPPLSLASCLFVCGDVLVSVQSFRFFFFLINNMQVQMLLWSFKLTVMCITSTVAQSCSKIFFSCNDWQANSPRFFLCCNLRTLYSLFRCLPPSVNLQY